MALDPNTYKVLQEQQDLVLAIDDETITELAKKIAFHMAMLDAALEDPFHDEEDQHEILDYLQKHLTEAVETYQSLINDKL